MPTSLVVYAILGFSLGVEAGNQLVLLPLYGTLRLIQARTTKTPTQQRLTIKQYASGAVALAGIYYLCADICALL